MERTIKREYNELCALVANMKYEDAFKALNGYNLTADPICVGTDGKFVSLNEFFDVTYKHINTSIFRTENNGCEVWEEFNVNFTMCFNGDIGL